MEDIDGSDSIVTVVNAIRDATRESTDAYLLAGVLIEGVVQVIVKGVSPERQAECGLASIQLMLDRLRAGQVI